MSEPLICHDKTSVVVSICDKFAFFALIFTLFFLPIYNCYVSIGIGFVIFFILIKFFSASLRIKITSLHTFLYIFLAACIFSFIFSTEKGETLNGLKKLSLHIFLYFLIINTVNSKDRLKWVINFFIFSAFIVSLDGFYQLMNGEDWFSGRVLQQYSYWYIKRITASFHQAGSLGMYLGTAVPVAWSLIFIKPSTLYYKISAFLIASVITLALIFSLTPGAAIGILFALFFFIVLKKGIKRLFYFIPVIGVGLFLLPYSLIGSFMTTILGRVSMWKIAIKIFSLYPLTGSGLRTFPVNYQKYCPAGYPFYRECPPYAHNMYLQLLSEIGFIGLICFFAFLYVLLSKIITIHVDKKSSIAGTLSLGLIGAFIVYMTHGIFESSIYTSQGGVLFWFLTGLMTSFIFIFSDKSKHLKENKDVREALFL